MKTYRYDLIIKLLFVFSITEAFISCSNRPSIPQSKNTETVNKTPGIDSAVIVDTPIYGYRFKIIGNFSADGNRDTFYEHYFSLRDNKETNKFYSGEEDIYDLDSIASEKKVISFFLSSNPDLDTLHAGGVFGPLFIKNEGDLDGDGGDEIGFVPSLPQLSSVNHYHILSLKHKKWIELYSFEIREWELPPIPNTGRSYGMLGSDGFYHVFDDSLNNAITQNLNKFHDLLKKLNNGKIRVKTFSEEAFDTTMVIDLKKLKY